MPHPRRSAEDGRAFRGVCARAGRSRRSTTRSRCTRATARRAGGLAGLRRRDARRYRAEEGAHFPLSRAGRVRLRRVVRCRPGTPNHP